MRHLRANPSRDLQLPPRCKFCFDFFPSDALDWHLLEHLTAMRPTVDELRARVPSFRKRHRHAARTGAIGEKSVGELFFFFVCVCVSVSVEEQSVARNVVLVC